MAAGWRRPAGAASRRRPRSRWSGPPRPRRCAGRRPRRRRPARRRRWPAPRRAGAPCWPASTSRRMVAFRVASPPASSDSWSARQAEVLRQDAVALHRAVAYLGHVGHAGDGHLVEPLAVDHEGVAGPQRRQHAAQHRHPARLVDPHHLVAGAGRVGQRPEQVEDGAHPQLAPDAGHRLEGGVEPLREEEADAHLGDGLLHHRRGRVDVDAQRPQHVGRAGARGDGAVAVLGHHHAGAGHHEGGGGRDVEGVPRVAAGAAGVDEDLGGDVDLLGAGPHHLGGAGDLLDGLALDAQRGQEGADLGRRGRAVGDLVHHRRHLGPGERVGVEQPRQRLLDHGVLLAPGAEPGQPVGEQRLAGLGQDRLGVELDALHVEASGGAAP